MKLYIKRVFSKKSLKKMVLPFLVMTQIVSGITAIILLVNKKKIAAGVFGGVSILATAASIVLIAKRMHAKRLKDEENEDSIFEDFDEDFEFIGEDSTDDEHKPAPSVNSEDRFGEAFSDMIDAFSSLENDTDDSALKF